MIDTPRVEARKFEILSRLQSGTEDVVEASFARQLERENAELKKLVEQMRDALEEMLYTYPYSPPCHGWQAKAAANKKAKAAIEAAERVEK